MSEWISFDERLPEATHEIGGTEFSEYVLAVDTEGDMGITHACYPHGAFGADTTPHFNKHCCDLEIITHWMPLPNPPISNN